MTSDPIVNLRARTIDEVIQSLDRIIAWSKEYKKRLGYFAALYRKVTVQVREGIRNGLFDDGDRMERLDVIFANRYLTAFEQYQTLQEPTLSWKLAFDTTTRWPPIVLQHLLIGMNAHIDLDLGVAAAETMRGQELSILKEDFFKINDILISLVNEVQVELAKVWPLLRLLDTFAGEADEALARFGMKLTRGHAWQTAEALSNLSPEGQALKIGELDQKIAALGKKILNPGYVIRLVLMIIRIGEIRSVARIIRILE